MQDGWEALWRVQRELMFEWQRRAKHYRMWAWIWFWLFVLAATYRGST